LRSGFFAASSTAAVIASAQGEALETQAPGQRQYRGRIAKYVLARAAPWAFLRRHAAIDSIKSLASEGRSPIAQNCFIHARMIVLCSTAEFAGRSGMGGHDPRG
jgi:hypothetical protein